MQKEWQHRLTVILSSLDDFQQCNAFFPSMAISSWKLSFAMSSLNDYVCNPYTKTKNLTSWKPNWIKANKVNSPKKISLHVSILTAEFKNPRRASMFIQMVEEVCFLKSWTLTKTAISKWVFNPYRQDLAYWKCRLMKINCIYSPKWFESVYFDEAKQALNDK